MSNQADLNQKSPFRSHIMSQEQLKTFISAVQDNSALQEQLNKAANAEAVFEIAKKAGLSVPATVMTALQLRGDDLETMSGGAMTPFPSFACTYSNTCPTGCEVGC